jgi:hypothetical protein
MSSNFALMSLIVWFVKPDVSVSKQRAALRFDGLDRAAGEDLVRQRAYELYQQRGREEGHALEHWLQAKEASHWRTCWSTSSHSV